MDFACVYERDERTSENRPSNKSIFRKKFINQNSHIFRVIDILEIFSLIVSMLLKLTAKKLSLRII